MMSKMKINKVLFFIFSSRYFFVPLETAMEMVSNSCKFSFLFQKLRTSV